MKISVLILTYNEQLHIARCIKSALSASDDIVLVDSYSSDGTISLATSYGSSVRVFSRRFITHAEQIRWALGHISFKNSWVLRLDADEILTSEFIDFCKGDNVDFESISGILLNRSYKFLGTKIRYGGVFPVPVLRMFRPEVATVDCVRMDEHVEVSGNVMPTDFEAIVDHNLHGFKAWLVKHLKYAKSQAHDYSESRQSKVVVNQLQNNRLIKEKYYNRAPVFLRCFAYFFYRYFIRFGCADRGMANIYHWVHGLGYRLLVDFFYVVFFLKRLVLFRIR